MPVVSIRSAVCVLGGFPALAGADLDVLQGEIVLLAGPNGAGKSTLLRLVAGLLPLRAGSATVLGHDLGKSRTAHRRKLSLVGHETACYDDLTVGENMRFALRAARASTEAEAMAVDRFGLHDLLDVRYAKLSAGQRRRLALAIGIAREPELLLLDEPHAGLDDEARDQLDSVLQAEGRDALTVVIASHELDRVQPLATRVAHVAGGRVRGGLVGEPSEQEDDARAPTPGDDRATNGTEAESSTASTRSGAAT